MDVDIIKLCNDCNNLMDFCLNKNKDPVYMCSKCFNIDDKIDYNHKEIEFNKELALIEIINKNPFIHLDVTLPKINNDNINCPNDKCPGNINKEKNNISYIKYDESNIKFIYICNKCGQKWSSDL